MARSWLRSRADGSAGLGSRQHDVRTSSLMDQPRTNAMCAESTNQTHAHILLIPKDIGKRFGWRFYLFGHYMPL